MNAAMAVKIPDIGIPIFLHPRSPKSVSRAMEVPATPIYMVSVKKKIDIHYVYDMIIRALVKRNLTGNKKGCFVADSIPRRRV